MVFSSLVFLCLFLPGVLLLYALCPRRCRNLLLLAASLLFYAWGEPKYIAVMMFSTVFDYANGRWIQYFENKNNSLGKKWILFLSVAGNLGILFVFKYTDFLLGTWNGLTSSQLELLGLALPIGISFYTFQTMSYTIDIYRGQVKAQKNLIAFAMYVSMFPQLIAGPIVRYKYIEKQVKERQVLPQAWVSGMQRFLIGLGKKVVFANQMGLLWQEISGADLQQLSMGGAWLGAIAYTFEIYFDFSGYSDMAIGLGQMFGFRYPENFNYPYEAKNITDFWRKWHITLGQWFREYVYIPLGGNRKGLSRQMANLFVVWILTGIWHGASWNFALWGLYFAVLLIVEKMFLLREMERWKGFFQHLYGKFFIVLGWVIFAVEDFGELGAYVKAMFGMGGSLWNQTAAYQWRNYWFFLLILAFASTRGYRRIYRKIRRHLLRSEPEFSVRKGNQLLFFCYSLYTLLVLLASLGMLVSGSYNPFLYFRF